MKKIGFVLVVIIAVFAVSCSTQSNFSKRKYRKGVFREHAKKVSVKKGKSEEEKLAFNPTTNFEDNTLNSKTTAKDSNVIEQQVSPAKTYEKIVPANPRAIIESIERDDPNQFEQESNYTKEDEEEDLEAKKTRDIGISGLTISLAGIGVYIATVITGLGPLGFLAILMAIAALVLSIIGLIRSIRQSLRYRAKGEMGKNAFALNLAGLIISAVLLVFVVISLFILLFILLALVI